MTAETTREIAGALARKIVAVAERERHNQGMGQFVYEEIVPLITAALDAQSAAFAERMDAAREVITAAGHALRSYQYGNASTFLAEEAAGSCDDFFSSAGTTDTPDAPNG